MVFQHEDFGGQLIWALGHYITVDIEGPKESLFAVADVAAPVAAAQAQQGGQVQQGGDSGDDDVAAQVEVTEPLPPVLQDLVGWQHLDQDDEVVATAAAPMVNNDNTLALENTPIPNAPTAPDIFSPWGHLGICYHCSLMSVNTNLKQKFWTTVGKDPSSLQLFEGYFFTPFIKDVIIPHTNKNLVEQSNNQLTYGEFLCWLGLWFLMATMIGPQHNEFWAMYPINAFKGAPLCLGLWMSWAHFNAILQALSFTGQDPPAYLDKFWEVQEMIDAWGKNMMNGFSPGHMNCLDESMSVWMNKFMDWLSP